MANVPVNVRHAAYALIASETKEAVTYGDVKILAPAMEFSATPNSDTANLYGNGKKQVTATKAGDLELSFGANFISLEDEAALCGHGYTAPDASNKERITVKDSDKAPYVGFGIVIDTEDGESIAVWHYKCKFNDPELSAAQSEDSVEFSTPTIEGTAVSPLSGITYEKVVFKPVSADEEPNYATLFGFTASTPSN